MAMVNTGSHIQSFKNEYLLGTHNEPGMQSASKKVALVLEIRPFRRRQALKTLITVKGDVGCLGGLRAQGRGSR